MQYPYKNIHLEIYGSFVQLIYSEQSSICPICGNFFLFYISEATEQDFFFFETGISPWCFSCI